MPRIPDKHQLGSDKAMYIAGAASCARPRHASERYSNAYIASHTCIRNEVKYIPAESFRPSRPLEFIAMDTLSVVDGTTVVVGPASIANRKELSRERSDDFPAKPYPPITNGVSKAKAASGHDFSKADFPIEDRPFFVPVGKDGITAALQKLDKQLQQVGGTSSHATRSPC